MADFYAPQFQPPVDVLGSYIRGQMAPLQVQAAQQDVQKGALGIDQLKLALSNQQAYQDVAFQQLRGQGYQVAGAQNQGGQSGGIQNGPQGAVSASTQPGANSGDSISGFSPSTLGALAILRGDDPLKTAEGVQAYQTKQRQLQAQGPLSLAETVASSDQADVLIKNNPSLQQQWIQLAPQLGLDPFKDLTPENARKAAILGYNNLAGQVGLPPKPMPVTETQVKGPAGEIYNKDPLTGKLTQVTGENLKQVVGPDGQPQYLPADQAVGKQPFNASIFGAGQITDQQKDLAYQTFVTTGAIPAGMIPRSDQGKAALWGYISQRAQQEGNTGAVVAAKGQSFKAAQGVVKDFESGQTSKTLNGLNTAISHMDILGQAADALGNGNVQALNRFKNFFGQEFGGTSVNNFNVVKNFAAGEVAKAVLPGGGGEKEREEIAGAIKNSNSPQQLSQAIGMWRQLLAGKTDALRNQWDVGTSGSQGSFDKFLLPATKKALGINEQAAPPAAAGAHPPAIQSLLDKYK